MSGGAATQFDPRAFRNALGSFATGVTVVTTRGASGEPVGLTVSSFNSVSLDPPLVLWSLACNSLSLPVFNETENWVVHVLAADQVDLSKRFSSRGTDKFAELEYKNGFGDAPLLHGCAARFQCRTVSRYEGGDHVIFVGEVLDFEQSVTAPLVFHGGRYAHALPKDIGAVPVTMESALSGNFTKDFLGYVLGRCHFQFSRRLTDVMESTGIDQDEYFVLAAIAVRKVMPVSDLQSLVGDLLTRDLETVLDGLQTRGFITREHSADGASICSFSPAGHDFAMRMLAAAKSFEEQVIEHVGLDKTFALKSLLNDLLTGLLGKKAEGTDEA